VPPPPNVGKGIDSPWRPRHFALHPDRRRGPARRQSPPAGLPEPPPPPPSLYSAYEPGEEEGHFAREPPALFPFSTEPPSPFSLLSLLYFN
jgi:hypothetical protein